MVWPNPLIRQFQNDHPCGILFLACPLTESGKSDNLARLWRFYVYVEPSGRVPFEDWRASVPEGQAAIDNRILQMKALRSWPDKWVSKYKGTKKLCELRITFNRVQYRPLGTYAPERIFILLGGGVEKGRIPASIIDAAVRRYEDLDAGQGHVREHRFD